MVRNSTRSLEFKIAKNNYDASGASYQDMKDELTHRDDIPEFIDKDPTKNNMEAVDLFNEYFVSLFIKRRSHKF